MAEPLRVLGDPRMVGRALPREIEPDLEPEAFGLRAKGVEIGKGAERGVDRCVTAIFGSDGPWAAWIVGPGCERDARTRC